MMPNKISLKPTIDKHRLDPNELTNTCFIKCLVFPSPFLESRAVIYVLVKQVVIFCKTL